MINRRNFIKSASIAGGATLAGAGSSMAKSAEDTGFFGVHPFVEANPDAVFIMRTDVDEKTNSDAKVQAGSAFAGTVIVPKSEEDGGMPIASNVAIKPNLTSRGTWQSEYDKTSPIPSMGVVTDCHFVEGVIESMKGLGLAGNQFYMREVNGSVDFEVAGYNDMAARTGSEIRSMETRVQDAASNKDVTPDDIVWKDVEEGIWFNRIPYLWPINTDDAFYLNIAKLKSHGMGITTTMKNLQGSIVHNYQAHCTRYGSNMDMIDGDVKTGASWNIRQNYERHVADGIPRWDRPGSSGGLWMETWASRCIDNHLVSKPNLHIVEGIYGRDGNFSQGPHLENGKYIAKDFMMNYIIFGMNPVYVDIISHWLAGHEPGNFGLFHLAIERGLATELNPNNIPLYEWSTDGSANRVSLDTFERTPLVMYYLQRDYDGQTEEKWHLCDEPYDYPTPTIVDNIERPEAIVLNQNQPNPFNPTTSISFSIPSSGNVRLEVYNMAGQLVDVLVNGYRPSGSHLAVWQSNRHAAGVYFYRLRYGGFTQTRKMTLLK